MSKNGRPRQEKKSTLDRAEHTDELVEDGKVHLRVDYKMSGIGSHSCGPALSKKYRLDEKEIIFEYSMKPLRAKKKGNLSLSF